MDETGTPTEEGAPETESSAPLSFETRTHGWKEEAVSFFRVLVIALAVVIPIRAYIVQPFVVRGVSMHPTYENGEYLIIDEFSYYFRAPARGEVVVFRFPKNPSQFFIKRIVGLPGERVQVKKGVVRIFNTEYPEGLVLDESYLPEGTMTSVDTELRLDEKDYFVMGDNRAQSADSRYWGALDTRYLIGRAWVRLWPVARAAVLQ